MQGNKDQRIIAHILDYCDRIFETKSYFDNSKASFEKSHVFRDAVALCVLQIGELTGVLSDQIKEKYNGIQWRQIKALRNIVAHRYGTVDAQLLWEIVETDIPRLEKDCKKILEDLEEQKDA